MASVYSGKFVGVRPVGSTGSYTYLPTPSEYKMTSATLVDSGRNTQGVAIASVIRSGVRKVEMSWNFLTQAQFSLIASFFDANFFFECQYYDTILGAMTTKVMYCGDRPSDTAHIKVEIDQNGDITEVKGYSNTTISLIER